MLGYTVTEEHLLEGFDLSDEVAVPAGSYRFARAGVRVRMGSHRKVSGMVRYEFGDFFGGTRQEVSYWGRAEINQRFSFEPNVSLNWIAMPAGDVRAQVSRLRATYTVSPRSFVGALVQYKLGRPTVFGQRPLPLGVLPRQRSVRGPEFEPGRRRRSLRSQRPGARRQVHPAVPVLTGSRTPDLAAPSGRGNALGPGPAFP